MDRKYLLALTLCVAVAITSIVFAFPTTMVAQDADPTPLPIPEPEFFPAGRSNGDWTPVVRDFDGVAMVLVPPGCFVMGSMEGEADEQPAEEVCIKMAFWIDQFEVSNAQFEEFEGLAAQTSLRPQPERPRESITWFEARDYCAQRGGRLPTEAEWEFAARGPESLVFPWGNAFDGSLVNFCDINCEMGPPNFDYDDGFTNTAPVGSFPAGASWVGAQDMSGNVNEWVSSAWMDYPYDPEDGREDEVDDPQPAGHRILRGGAFYTPISRVRASDRFRVDAIYDDFDAGLRCVRDVETNE